jgi:hypothetical protein
MEHKIAVGNEYRRTLGAVKQFVTITGYDTVMNKWQYATKSGKIGTADEATIEKWEVIKVVETAVEETAVVETAKVEKKKNNCTCLEAAIQTLIRRNVPMTAKMLVKAMVEDGAFHFSPTAKTPWNSVGTRLTTYMNNCEGECRIKQTERGKFVHSDYVAPIETETETETVTA